MNRMKRWFREHKGLTLVELMVVLAILGVLAAIIVPAVTGTTSKSRSTTQAEDINQAQNALDRFNADDTDGKAWPTDAPLTGSAWVAGQLPTADKTGTGTSGDPYVFTQLAIAALKWDSPATTAEGSKAYYPDYLRNKPRHADETITVANGAASSVFPVQKGGSVVYVQLSNTHTAPLNFPKWGVDKTGTVWVFVDKDVY